MTDLEFCEWVRLRAEATEGPGMVHRRCQHRLIEATDRLCKSYYRVKRMRAALRFIADGAIADPHPDAANVFIRAANFALREDTGANLSESPNSSCPCTGGKDHG